MSGVRRWLAGAALAVAWAAAGEPITKEDIVRIYAEKAALVEGCRVTVDEGRVGAERRFLNRTTYYLSNGRLRQEPWILVGGTLVPDGIITDDGEEYRSLSLKPDGSPLIGTIRPSDEGFTRMMEAAVTPIGLSDLLRHSDFGVDTILASSSSQWQDVAWLAARPETRVLAEPRATERGEAAVVMEHVRSGGGILRLWLLPDRNYALGQYESVHVENGVETVMTRLVHSDFVEAAEGLHLPRTSTFHFFSLGEQGVYANAEYELNGALEPDLFRLSFPDGTYLEDEILGTKHVVGAAPGAPSVYTRRIKREIIWMAWGAAAVCAAVAVLGAGVYWGERRRRVSGR